MNILLLHATLDGGYRNNLARLRQIEAGAQALHPGTIFLRALGHTPDEDPLAGAPPSPDRILGRVRALAGEADLAWACPPSIPELADQVAIVEQLGVRVDRLTLDQVELLLERGLQAERARGQELAARALVRVLGEEDRERGWSAEGVVLVWLRGAESVLGARALPLPPPDGQGNLHARVTRQVEVGLRLALASGVMRRAQEHSRWPAGGADVLRAVLLGGFSCAAAAAVAGLPNAMAASRAHHRALECVREVLLEMRDQGRQEDQR